MQLSVIYVAAIMVLLSLMLFLLSVMKTTGKTPVLLLSYHLGDLLSGLLYIPCMGTLQLFNKIGTLLLGVRCESKQGVLVSYLDPTVICFSGAHMGSVPISIFSAFILLLVSMFYKLFVHGKCINIDNPLNQISVSSDFIFHILRTILLLLFVALPNVSPIVFIRIAKLRTLLQSFIYYGSLVRILDL